MKYGSLHPIDRVAYWMTTRETVRIRKEGKGKKPYTNDEIFQQYRFCNVRRMSDKVSRWLYDNWYLPNFDHPYMPVAVALARFINKPESLAAIEFPTEWKGRTWKAILRKVHEYNAVFNAAYLVRAHPGEDKITSVIDRYVKPLHDKPLRLHRHSMEETWAEIVEYNGYGSFMAGQVVADLRWAMRGTWRDRDRWAPMGPGSQRGLNRFYEFEVNNKWDQLGFLEGLRDMRQLVTPKLPTLLVAKLEMHDWQNVMCEFDKYERIYWGEGRPKQRYSGR